MSVAQLLAPKSRPRLALLALACAIVLAAGWTIAAFSGDVRQARQRVGQGSATIPTSFGQLEFAVAGSGTPLLMIHGTGGGFDQGLSFAANIMARGHQIIAPSRFGYLRSDYPPDPSSENQADALVALLVGRCIQRIPA